jgi:hypothetical protein
MMGTITVRSAEAPPEGPPPGSGEATGSPLAGPASSALRVAKRRRGAIVHGSIALSQAAAGGRLEVALLAPRAKLLGAGRSGAIRVGRLARSNVKPGRVSFAVALKGTARRALREDTRLPLTVRVVVTPPQGHAVSLKRWGVLHV